ncbi:UDP:flavonoid glycosyltransferase YjiC, YdhE family [Streptomyces misionensis]|uniref:UDP:flavonoid glycosyltransferase YjiC, YdhE family n=1 Tax=Streptomyces misionensis TaxID=67331 RepID=A0A1H4IAN9_9ACTN|nr:nucleotide disphospho-sugar-binding domain-containing protein [Streptomyces misionensis]SEB31033.1 UDP:flavonoid glycosyltransferase YjiC, YdhE family [Streptomyces misionensis]
MRVLFVTAVMPSHYFVMAPFAWALRAAGHEVYAATHPELVDTVAASGIPVVGAGPPVDFARRYRERAGTGRPAAADPKTLFCDIADGMADDVVRFARAWWPDVVVWEPSALAGPLVAAVTGALSLRCPWGPDIVGRGLGRDNLPPEFGALFERFGLRLADVPEWWNLDACPEAAQVPGMARRLPVRYVPYSSAGRVPSGVLERPAGRPRICVALGITMTEVAGPDGFFAPRVLDALCGLDVELVAAVVAGQRPLLGTVPQGVRVVEDCALHMLIPSCDLVIHHGGTGTMLTAALHGVPQLALSHSPDQRFFAVHLARTGAGSHLPAAEAGPAELRGLVGELLGDPACRAAAAALRDAMTGLPTLADYIPVVERLAAGDGAADALAPIAQHIPQLIQQLGQQGAAS